jgi:benzoyl-CoA reductase/2-hydroxyglutaryl-CoA dehydratase subunit BcrC/BadD/HgdB
MNDKTAPQNTPLIGYTCAYTPLALIDAAGFTPYRIFPMGEWPDQAGRLLHDNLCPHIKRVLDRALDNDLPDLSGMVFINSCDAMRRLADAWKHIRPKDKIIVLDLPATAEEINVSFYGEEISWLWDMLISWKETEEGDKSSSEPEKITKSVMKYNQLSLLLQDMEKKIQQNKLAGGSPVMQEIYNRASTEPPDQTIAFLKDIGENDTVPEDDGVPVFVFGNMLADPDVFSLFEKSGATVAGNDFCTGSRLFHPMDIDESKDIFVTISHQLLSHPPCARTFNPSSPASIASDILSKAKACDARGVIGHIMKFCDPYLARIPLIRKALQEEGIPMLVIEGDCTTRSIGQQRTRIEAFIEMLR